MIYFKSIIALGFIIFILDKLYILPIYVPLDTKPDNRRTAAHLARTIAKEAKCDDISLLDINYEEGHTTLSFDCTFEPNIYFDIYVFLNDEARDNMIKNRNKDSEDTGYHRPCFKKGPAYMICEAYVVKDKKAKPIFKGQPYYSQFPGEDITFTENK